MPTLTFDVTDPLYGATGDGSTDDRPAIAAAIAAAEAAALASPTKRAVVHFPPGIYSLNSFGGGSLNNGTWCFKIGAFASGGPISLHFTGSNATLKNTIWQSTGNSTRSYRTFDIYSKLSEVRFSGLTFLHEAPDVLNTLYVTTSALGAGATSGDDMVEDFVVTDCEFIDHTWAFVASYYGLNYGEGYKLKRFEFSRNRVLGKSYDVTAAVIQSVNGGIGIMEEVIITDNFFDGARTGDVSDSFYKRGADGFVFMSPRRAVINNNVVKHAGVEAIFLTPPNSPPMGPPRDLLDRTAIVVSGNMIDGKAPVGQVADLPYGIRIDTPNTVVSGNTIVNCAKSAIYLNHANNTGSTPARTLCHGNHIQMEPSGHAGAISCTGDDIDVKDNVIWLESYVEGVAGEFAAGIGSSGNGHRITGNRILALTKPSLGGPETVGISIGSPGQKDVVVSGNYFQNLNNVFFDWGSVPDTQCLDNEVLNCDRMISHLSGWHDRWVGGYWCRRQVLAWAPVTTGWHRVAAGSAWQFSGRLRISSTQNYGGFADGTMRPMNAEVVIECREKRSGQVMAARLIQTNSSNLNGGPVTKARLVTHPVNTNHWWLELYVDSATDAGEILLEWDTSERAAGLVIPAPQSDMTPRASLILGPGYRYSENNDPLANGSLMRLGDTGYLWVDSNDKLRIATSTPSQSDETSHGTVVGSQV